MEDLWERLLKTDKKIYLYGMGNGADKLLSVLERKQIPVSGVFASDGFVRKKIFHGMELRSYSEVKETVGAENLLVLLAFGTSLPDVLANIRRIGKEAELYAPDLPVFGDTLFDGAFAEAHRDELLQVRNLFSDDLSKKIFDGVLAFKLTGEIRYLEDAQSDPKEDLAQIVCPGQVRTYADLGAYNGDTVRMLLDAPGSAVRKVYAFEPDEKNFKKLEAYAKSETRAEVIPLPVGAWDKAETLLFDESGNRNASFLQNKTKIPSGAGQRVLTVRADRADRLIPESLDFIKYDVEGSEARAIDGSRNLLCRDLPTLLVSLYHRSEDLFALPLKIFREYPAYDRFYLRRAGGVPAWDLNLFVKKERKD